MRTRACCRSCGGRHRSTQTRQLTDGVARHDCCPVAPPASELDWRSPFGSQGRAAGVERRRMPRASTHPSWPGLAEATWAPLQHTLEVFFFKKKSGGEKKKKVYTHNSSNNDCNNASPPFHHKHTRLLFSLHNILAAAASVLRALSLGLLEDTPRQSSSRWGKG